MKIIHSLSDEIHAESESASSFLLTNKKGGFYFGSFGPNTTKFNGLFFLQGSEMIKCVERIGAFDTYDTMINNGSSFVLKNGKSEETYYLNHSNTLVYEISGSENPVSMSLDCRKCYDFSDQGRIYNIYSKKGCIIVHYKKYVDASLSNLDYEIYIAIKTKMAETLVQNWTPVSYSLDAARNSSSDFYVYDALRFTPDSGKNVLVVAYADSEKKAIDQAQHIFKNTAYIKRLKKKYAASLVNTPLRLRKTEKVAYQNALLSFDNLIADTSYGSGIFAGLPWFFQFWGRDEAISSIALLYEERYDLMKSLLLKWLDGDGRVSNRIPASELSAADATGWVYFRLHQLLLHLQSKKLLKAHFSTKELKDILKHCSDKLEKIEQEYMRHGLMYNDPLETWMDTSADGDVRDGFRIEIQALHVASYNLILYLSDILDIKSEAISKKKERLVKNIRDNFYNGSYLFDGISDPIIRPNIFIAAYVAPDLLSKKEWILCFRKALKSLFMNYGGISTIDTKSSLYRPFYTGENNLSYHRGDVWYWLTALAGIVLHKVDSKEFSKEIQSMRDLFIDELLWSGVPGTISEISSSMEHTSSGCASQAWSLAVYIEFINRINSSVNQKII